jgi:hypothetical protein
MEGKMQTQLNGGARISVTLIPQEDLIFRILDAAVGKLSFQDVLKLTELRHEVMSGRNDYAKELLS